MLYQLEIALKEAMKSKNKSLIIGLRNIINKLKLKQINKGSELNNNESIKILYTIKKQLVESIKMYKEGDREDLVKKEKSELKLVESYLPEEISKNEIVKVIKNIININNLKSKNDIGKIMGLAMKEFNGIIDGKLVKNIVIEELN